jgi:hypothetical protein
MMLLAECMRKMRAVPIQMRTGLKPPSPIVTKDQHTSRKIKQLLIMTKLTPEFLLRLADDTGVAEASLSLLPCINFSLHG